MAESVKSERSHTRFSTPVSELDDHRHQEEQLPAANRSRRGTAASNQAADALSPGELSAALQEHGMIARDFEHAIVDDDRSGREEHLGDSMFVRRGSHSPVLARRNTFRRTRDEIEARPRSLASSKSSRSISPPNSVDAFADTRRRERAGTINSMVPSDLDLALHRTVSGGTHRRRGTFSEERPKDALSDAASTRSSAEEDVCFPVQETGRTADIDFEELEEFIAENHEKTPIVPSIKRKSSVISTASKPRVFSDLRPQANSPAPMIASDGSVLQGLGHAAAVLSEKLGEVDGEKHEEKVTVAEEPPQNRWTFFSSELDDTIHAPELSGLLMPGETFRDLFEQPHAAGVWWLDMLNPTEEEVFAICKAFNVHPLTREDITTQEAREKVELFNKYYFVCFRSFCQTDQASEDFLEPVNVYAVVFREGLLTFTFCENPHAANVRKRIGRLRDYVSLSSDWICYALIDDIVDSFGPVIRDVEHETDAIEDNVFTARAEDSRAILRSIGDCRKKVMSLLRLLGGKADVIKGFAKRCNEHYDMAPRGDVGLYLSDIQDHVVTMMSNLAHFEKMLSRSHSNYLAQISVDSLMQGNSVNETLGKVTLIATILVPLNLICGLFGMNVKVPGEGTDSLAWWFGILGVIAGFVVFCLLVAKRMKFI